MKVNTGKILIIATLVIALLSGLCITLVSAQTFGDSTELNFGDSTVYSDGAQINDNLYGLVSSPSSSGIATSISVYLDFEDGKAPTNVRAALYRIDSWSDKHATCTLLSLTNERSVDADGWWDFGLASSQNVSAGIQYVLAAWAQERKGNIGRVEMCKESSPIHWSGVKYDLTYRTWPTNPVFEGENYYWSIYCTYVTGIPAASLTVTSPNGGESWVRGTTQAISWSYTASSGPYVKIELLKGEVSNTVISYSTYNVGSFSWTIPSMQAAGTDYKIRITSTTYPAITDTSTSSFVITSNSSSAITVSFTTSPPEPTVKDIIHFTDTSTCQDGVLQSWQWDFGDGNSSTLRNPSHQYSVANNYTVSLTVTDDSGSPGTLSKRISVKPSPNATPQPQPEPQDPPPQPQPEAPQDPTYSPDVESSIDGTSRIQVAWGIVLAGLIAAGSFLLVARRP